MTHIDDSKVTCKQVKSTCKKKD